MNKKIIAIIGALTVILGVFSPLFTVPIVGSISYAGQMQEEGLILVGAAIVSFLFCLNNVYAPSFITGLLVLGDVGLTLNNFYSKIGSIDTNNPFAQAVVRTVSPSFGFAILIIGAGLLITSAFRPIAKETDHEGKATKILHYIRGFKDITPEEIAEAKKRSKL